MAKLSSKDCSPFVYDEKKKLNQDKDLKKYLPQLIRKQPSATDDEAEDERFFVFSDRDYDTDDEAIVYQKSDGKWLAGRYVGKCKIDGCEIEIKPRFGTNFLLTMLDEVYNLKLRKSFEAAGNEKDKWESIVKLALYVIWTNKFMDANRYGLPRRVVKREYVGNKIKSHLNVRKSIKTMHTRQQLVSEYYERDYDDAICKIVYHAYKILEKISRMPIGHTPQMVKETIMQLESHYHAVDLTVTPHEYNNIRYKSIYASWKPLVDLSWQIIQQQFGLIESQSSSYAVFIDVAEIWEQYLRKRLADAFKDDGWHCWTVEETKTKVYKGMFYSRKIIPDIVLNHGDEYMVFDAKYKTMNGRGDDVDRCDFFQIHSYIQYLQSKKDNNKVLVGGLLYPIASKISEDEILQWHSQRLWGESENKTPFIVDGIVCDEEWEKIKPNEENSPFIPNTEAFIKRIKDIIEVKNK